MVDRETIVISSSDTGEDEPKPKRLATASSSSVGGSSGNSLLASLHEARVARHGEPPPAPAPAPAAAARKAAVPRRHLSIAQRVGDDGRIHWRSNDESIESFLAATAPSRVSSRDAAWIQVENITWDSPGYGMRAGNFDPSAYQAVLAARLRAIEQKRDKETKAECVKDLLRIATQQGYTTGKWLLFAKPEFIDAVWRIVATATANGELGCSAKVSPAAGVADNVLICVYVRDFNERSELRRVLDKLMKLMPKEGDLKFFFAGFKADAFTSLEINAKNVWKLNATLYSGGGAIAWEL